MRSKYSSWIGLPFLFLISLFTSTFSHPLDISYTTLTIRPNNLYGETYIHPYELNLLAQINGINFHRSNFLQLSEIIIPYFIKHFKAFVGTQPLKLQKVKADSVNYADILSYGLSITFKIPKLSGHLNYNFEITLFTSFFSTQTNKLVLLDENGEIRDNYREIFFTKKRTKWTLNISNPYFSKDYDDNTDTDKDGLNDHLEKLYGTNPESKDTDSDRYTDFEEFYMGWDPLNYRASKGQNRAALAQIEKIDNPFLSGKEIAQNLNKSSLYSQDRIILPHAISPDTGANLSTREREIYPIRVPRPRSKSGNDFLGTALQKIEDRLKGSWTWGGLLTALGIVFILGFIHAISAGHGKEILFSYMVNVNHQFGHALRFVIIYTITHLIYIMLYGISVFAASNAVEPATLTPIMQKLGGVGLLMIAFYQIYNGIKALSGKKSSENASQNFAARFSHFMKELGLFGKRSHKVIIDDNKDAKPSSKKASAWLVGLLTGLTPCPAGWAIFMLLSNIEKTDFLFWVIPVFGLAIIISLLLFAILVLLFRQATLRFIKGANQYSILVSGIMLLIFSIYFMLPSHSL